jgi:hypothetical protein
MNVRGLVWAAALFLASTAIAIAHHSFAAEYDGDKRITLKGTVTKVEFMNPHIWIYVDVADEKGAVTKWQAEGGAPNSLKRQGWTKDSLKPGEVVTIDGALAKDGSKTVNARSVVLVSTGRRLFAGSSEGKE